MIQVNNTGTLNGLEKEQTQYFFFSALTEGQGADGMYDLPFTIDPSNTTGDAYSDIEVFRSTVRVVN